MLKVCKQKPLRYSTRQQVAKTLICISEGRVLDIVEHCTKCALTTGSPRCVVLPQLASGPEAMRVVQVFVITPSKSS